MALIITLCSIAFTHIYLPRVTVGDTFSQVTVGDSPNRRFQAKKPISWHDCHSCYRELISPSLYKGPHRAHAQGDSHASYFLPQWPAQTPHTGTGQGSAEMPKDWIVHEKTIAKIERSFRFYRDAGDSKKSSMEKSLRMFGNWQTRSLLNPRSNGRHGGNADEAREILLAELERILEE